MIDNIQQTIAQEQPEGVPFGTVQHNLSNIKPTSMEINHLWSCYMAESMACCFQKHMVAKAKDSDLRNVLQSALELSSRNIQRMEELFNSIQFPIPEAFGEKDVDVNAPPLFDEGFTVRYTRLMTKYILVNHSWAFSEASRSDFRKLFSDFIDGSKGVIEKADQVLLAKGFFPKSPFIESPDRVDYIHDKKYYGSLFGSDRPLNVLEISNIFAILDFNMAMKAINLGFAQVITSDKLRKHLNRAEKILDKHVKILGTLLEKQGLPSPELVNYKVTDSKKSPYSDKLLMFHVSVTMPYISTSYGLGLSRILRKDIIADYSRLMAEIIEYSKDCADILIVNGWLERIPETINRKELTH